MESISTGANYNSIEKEQNDGMEWNTLISAIYIGVILGIFPVVFHDYYFDILVFKYQFYYVVTLVYVVLIACGAIFSWIIGRKTRLENQIDFVSVIKKLSVSELSIAMFMLIAIVSTVQSDFLYESIWGNEGRFTGCFTLLLYGTSMLLIIKYARPGKWMLHLFLFSGMLICYFGITDYFQLDILRFKVDMDPNQYSMFSSTIGNVNTYTSYVALVLAVSTLLFSIEKVYWKAAIYYFCMISSFFAIIMGLSDNSYLSIMALFGLMPLYLFKTKMGVRRYLLTVTTFFGVIYAILLINRVFAGKVIEMQGILQAFSRKEIVIVLLLMIFLTILAYGWGGLSKNKKENLGKRWQIAWFALLVILTVVLLFALYDVNIAKNTQRYGSLGTYLLFDDNWGTHRGYNWRIGLENYSRFSLLHKIFGYGPDTYGIVTHFNNFQEMTEKYQETYDSAHNEYLQYFITMGPLSLVSYLVLIVSSIVSMWKKLKTKPYIVSIIFAVVCYCIQASVNISVPIVTPIMFVLLAVGLSGKDTTGFKNHMEKLNQ